MKKSLMKRWIIGCLLIGLLSSCLFGNVMVSADTKDEATGISYALYGDLNGDDDVSASDALTLLQVVVGKHEHDENARCIAVSDVNKDGKISAADALNVLQFVVGKIQKFPAGKYAALHTWGEWQVQLTSTFTEHGKEARRCTVCGFFQWRDLPLLPDMSEQYQVRVLELVNIERAKEGIPALKAYPQWQWAASQRAADLNQVYSHTRPNGQPWHSLVTGYKGWISLGENIAMGQQTPEEVVTAWMNSPGHRQNIMDKTYTHLIVGATPCADQSFLGYCWVQIFCQF